MICFAAQHLYNFVILHMLPLRLVMHCNVKNILQLITVLISSRHFYYYYHILCVYPSQSSPC